MRILADHRSDNINQDDANEAGCLQHRVLQRVRSTIVLCAAKSLNRVGLYQTLDKFLRPF